jgi:death-on-curing protein
VTPAPGSPAPRFLSVDDILTLHAIAIQDQGGDPSIRDRSLLESAVAMPAQQFGGRYVHEDIPTMAAAYGFHICKNHPFVDGNKRAAAAAMIAFLSDNGWSFDATADEAEPVILQLAAGALDRPAFTDWARNHMREKPKMELREFFRAIDPKKFAETVDVIRRDAPGNTVEQLQATVDEVAEATPLIPLLVQNNSQAVQNKDESLRLYTAGMITILCALYRLAEDMGYEW